MNLDQSTRTAIMATSHCLMGCGIGEVLGMVITNAPHRKTGPAIIVSVVLAFFFGYLLSLIPLLRSGMKPEDIIRKIVTEHNVRLSLGELRLLLAARRVPPKENR